MRLQRREFVALLGVCASNVELLAQHDHQFQRAPISFVNYDPKALTHSEYDLVDKLAETLLPADQTGPGAHAAHVAYYIDVILYHSTAKTLNTWRGGLAQVEALAGKRFHQSFSTCSEQQRGELMAELSRKESTPQTESDHFFTEFKRTVIDGFYASELVQREHLGYKGNTAITQFTGCTHPAFQHSDT